MTVHHVHGQEYLVQPGKILEKKMFSKVAIPPCRSSQERDACVLGQDFTHPFCMTLARLDEMKQILVLVREGTLWEGQISNKVRHISMQCKIGVNTSVPGSGGGAGSLEPLGSTLPIFHMWELWRGSRIRSGEAPHRRVQFQNS